MKSSVKAASSVGAIALILAGSATAVTPGLPGDKSPFGANTPVFDQWSVTNGTIGASDCNHADFTCGDALKDNGFFMRLITDTASGEMFFQTIVTEYDVTGSQSTLDQDLNFSDENFVSGSNNSGILDKQRLTQTETMNTHGDTVRFENFTEIGTGWATDYLILTQTIREDLVDTTTFNDFQTDFIFHQDGYSTDLDKGVGMKITQYVPILNHDTYVDGQGNTIQAAIDSQDLVLVDLRGSYVPHSGSIYVDPNEFDSQNQLGGGTMTWGAGDRIYATWIGQDIGATVGQQFGFVAYDNAPETQGSRIQSFTLADSWLKSNNDDLGGNPDKVPGAHTDQNGTVVSTHWDTNLWGDLRTSGTLVQDPTFVVPPFPDSHPALLP